MLVYPRRSLFTCGDLHCMYRRDDDDTRGEAINVTRKSPCAAATLQCGAGNVQTRLHTLYKSGVFDSVCQGGGSRAHRPEDEELGSSSDDFASGNKTSRSVSLHVFDKARL
ncbi:hypothetical protein MTO96_010527 [Rhipicephalus appendiculatus]